MGKFHQTRTKLEIGRGPRLGLDRRAPPAPPFALAAVAAAKLLEPKTQRVHLTSGTLKNECDVQAWVAATEKDLLGQLKNGPIAIS